QATTDAEGRFSVEKLPPGAYRLLVRAGENQQWLAPAPVAFAARSGEAVEGLEVAMERGWPVTGRCVRAGTGEPVPGVAVMVRGGGNVFWRHAETDEDGRFTVYALPGQVHLSTTAPKQYLDRQDIPAVDVVAESGATVPDIELERAAIVTGVVVDEAGEPAPGAEVWGSAHPEPTHDLQTVADSAGRFELTGVPVGSELTLQASTMTAVTRLATTVVTAEETEPLRLVVSAEAAGFATGRVVDDQGAPQAGVTVTIYRHTEEGGSPSRRSLRQVTTDADGRYETGALAPGMTWEAAVPRGMLEDVRSEEWVCARGETHEVPDIVMDVARGTLAGVVVDADGQPLAGIEVFNAGDGPEAVTTQTDEAGHFRLEGLWEGTAWAFARAEGLRPACARGETGDDDLRITLLPADARPDAPGNPPADELAARRALAQELALEALAGAPPNEALVRGPALAALACANPALAEQTWQDEGRPAEATFVQALAESLAETDANAAIERILATDTSVRATALISVGRAAADREPELAAEAFSLAATAAESTPDPVRRATVLAQAGRGLLALGYAGGGELVRQAAAAAAEADPEDYGTIKCLMEVAPAVAEVDVDQALALAQRIMQSRQWSYVGGQTLRRVACVVARTDPDRAVAILATAGDHQDETADAAHLAWEMYQADPAKALEYARGQSHPMRSALALGYLALRQDDGARAWELIDEAAALLAPLAEGVAVPWGGSGYPVAAARLAQVAQDVGYPDVQRLVTLALMLRSPRPRWLSEERYMWGFADLRGALAWSDAEVARVLLEPAVGAPGAFDPEVRSEWDKLLRAMASVDPEWAAMKVRELAAERPDAEPFERWRWHIELARYLALTREEQIRESIGGWLPGKWEDE
ncbi:MAG TPA: carboxypeptidase regulatory-like domain-containing protein, partial [Armatimonadota bacterium]|nr:carboxypeptidase regulatory-like domain-containing protein [Armatimonadota bacterium]